MTSAAPDTPAIRVHGIKKAFKDVHVLRGVNFEVTRGSIFALLGSNGAGKTTLIRILSTLLALDAGTATVNGFDVAMDADKDSCCRVHRGDCCLPPPIQVSVNFLRSQ